MKHIYLNLRRFDLPTAMGGVNSLCPPMNWARQVTEQLSEGLNAYPGVEFAAFFPEAHLLSAFAARAVGSPLRIGCQGVSPAVIPPEGGTSLLPAEAAVALGCGYALLGEWDEREAIRAVLAEAGVPDEGAVNRVIGKEFRRCRDAGLQTVLCIGEKDDRPDDALLAAQLRDGLSLLEDWEDRRGIVIAYEPAFVPTPERAATAAKIIGEITGGMDAVCAMTADNAEALAAVPGISGGLISVTHALPEPGFAPEEFRRIAEAYLGDKGQYFEIG